MFGTNTTALAQNSYAEGRKEGVDAIMTRLSELIFDDPRFTEEERKALKRAYYILDEEFFFED